MLKGDPLKEFLNLHFPRPRHRHQWGRWMYNAKSLTLQTFREGHFGEDGFVVLEVDLEDCTTGLKILDWVLQIAAWNTQEDIGNLVMALRDLCPNLQLKVCPRGQSPNKPEPHVDFKKIIQEGGKHE